MSSTKVTKNQLNDQQITYVKFVIILLRKLESVKRNTLRRFGHIERMGSEEFVRKVYVSESVGPNSRGRPPGTWRDRVKEYMCERGATRGGGYANIIGLCLRVCGSCR